MSALVQTSVAVPIGRRPRAVIAFATLLGAAAFLWPFFVRPPETGGAPNSTLTFLMFGGLLVIVMAIAFSEVAAGGIDSKAIAMLGVLSAIGAALRPLGAGTAGIETIFFMLVLAGRVFGPGFGFVLGCTTLFSSALVTGGVGPWLPYQMFGCAWVGMLAGMLPRATGRRELAMLAAFGAVSGYLYGLFINLSFWPFSIDPQSTIAYLPGAAVVTNLARYVAYDVTTSLGWDTGRALTNVAAILIVGPAVLATLRRAARKAAFRPAGRT